MTHARVVLEATAAQRSRGTHPGATAGYLRGIADDRDIGKAQRTLHGQATAIVFARIALETAVYDGDIAIRKDASTNAQRRCIAKELAVAYRQNAWRTN